MTTEEGAFLRRWARRKEEARRDEQAAEVTAEPAEAEGEPLEPDEPSFDPASLPPVESLGPGSDFAAFLRRGVPPALRAAALRRAWASTPAIVAHRPLVEYDWDWHAPGYGRLRPEDDAGPLLERLFGHLREPAGPAPATEAAPPAAETITPETSLPETMATERPVPERAPPPQTPPEAPPPGPAVPDALAAGDGPAPGAPPRRRHGGAAPT